MEDPKRSRVLVIGAGSMGLIVGYHLTLAGASVTFLIRPHRAPALRKPQRLYSYNDHELKLFSDYDVATSPATAFDQSYDVILITLDGVSLQNETGRSLVRFISERVREQHTHIVLGTVFPDLKSWFCIESGLHERRVANAALYIHAYSPKAVSLPLHSPTSATRLAEADLAYADSLGPGLVIDDSSPIVAKEFTSLYNRSKVSTCMTISADDLVLQAIPPFAILAACELMDWPKLATVDPRSPLWVRGVEAVGEIQSLLLPQDKRSPTDSPSASQVLASWVSMEESLWPLDLQEFYRYHHGSKVNDQDRAILAACKSRGKADRAKMPALTELLQKFGRSSANNGQRAEG